MTARCSSEPVSWLRLEMLHAGDVDASERARIEEHLAACPACAACFARITEDEAVALPPLEVPDAKVGRVLRMPAQRVGAIAGVLALAAAAVLGLGRAWRSDVDDGIAGSTGGSHVKGDGIAFTLVRDDDARIVEAGGIFRDRDRFKAVVTCPPSKNLAFDVVVFDEGGASFPLDPATGLSCGNDVPLPGAFRLTGTTAETVCIVWSEDGPVDRDAVSRSRGALGDHAACKLLSPASPASEGER